MGDFELDRGHHVYATITATTISVTKDAKGIKLKILMNF